MIHVPYGPADVQNYYEWWSLANSNTQLAYLPWICKFVSERLLRRKIYREVRFGQLIVCYLYMLKIKGTADFGLHVPTAYLPLNTTPTDWSQPGCGKMDSRTLLSNESRWTWSFKAWQWIFHWLITNGSTHGLDATLAIVYRNQDLLGLIFSNLIEYKPESKLSTKCLPRAGLADLLQVGLTCKAFVEPVLDLLWYQMDSLLPLLHLISKVMKVAGVYVCCAKYVHDVY